jgi:hypothetical protein
MKRFLPPLLVLLACTIAAAQSALLSPSNPSIEVSFPNTPYKIRAKNIYAVDFHNIRLHIDEKLAVQLRNGKYNHRDKDGFDSVDLDAHCVEGEGGSSRYAIVEWTWIYGYGSSNSECAVQVFALRSEHPVVVQQLYFDCHALTAGSMFDTESKKLTIGARTDDDSPHCCAKTLDVVSYVWAESKFEQATFDRIPALVKKGPDGLEEH